MKVVREYIEQKQLDFARHPFFARLDAERPLDEVARFIPRLAFWVMVFQDILRLNEQRTFDPQLRRIARHHRAEDAGHERWFLDDLRVLGMTQPDVGALFGPAHVTTRDAAYALMAEVFRADRDHERIALLLSLEATGHVFFEAMAACLERLGNPLRIKYFSRHHIEVEKSHEMFEERMTQFLEEIELGEEERTKIVALIDRTHLAFTDMFDGFVAVIDQQHRSDRAATG